MGGMHELSLLRGVIDAVNESVPDRNVLAIGMKVGTRSGVDVYALRQAWDLARVDTTCETSRLDLDIIPAAVWCPQCEDTVEIDEYFALRCPKCDTPTADLRGGDEFQVTWVDVE